MGVGPVAAGKVFADRAYIEQDDPVKMQQIQDELGIMIAAGGLVSQKFFQSVARRTQELQAIEDQVLGFYN